MTSPLISSVSLGIAAEAVAIEYVVEGPRTASAIVRGETRLVGVALHGGGEEDVLTTRNVGEVLLALGDLPRVYENAVFARTVERVYGFPMAAVFDDVRVMRRLLGWEDWEDEVTLDAAVPRARRILECFQAMIPRITEEQLACVYAQIELPVIDATIEMMVNGVGVDLGALELLKTENTVQINECRRRICEIVGRRLNPESANDIRDLLYGEYALPVRIYSLSGRPSTCDAALQELAECHPVVPLLRQYRAVRSVLPVVTNLIQHATRDGRVHAEIDPLGADSGRFSCRQPNLQGLPREVLQAVRAPEGRFLLELDTSQAELRVLAHFSQEPSLVSAFQTNDIDLHRRTAALALGLPEHTVTSTQRNTVGKAVNFGIIYGETEYGLAKQLGVSEAEAGAFIEGYFQGYPCVAAWINTVDDFIDYQGYVSTFCGRRRRLPHVWSGDPAEVHRARRQAVNTIIQGTAADLLKLAISRLYRSIPDTWKLLLTVHDSVLLEVPEPEIHEAICLLRALFEQQPPGFTIPMPVEAKFGRTWGECKDAAPAGRLCEVGCSATPAS